MRNVAQVVIQTAAHQNGNGQALSLIHIFDLHIKDLNNALDTGHGLGTPMLLTAQVQEMLQWLHRCV